MDPELERLMSPKMWSHRLSPQEVVNKHVEVVQAASETAKAVVPCDLGVQYGPTEAQRLDIFGGEALPTDAPIAVYIHGGYWQAMSRESSSFSVLPLHKAGVRVIVMGYDLAPAVKLGDIVEQVIAAGKFILELAVQLRSRSICFVGHCAGAQMVVALLASDWFNSIPENQHALVQGCVLISGVYDLAPLVYTSKNDALKLTSEEIRTCSPMFIAKFLPNSVQVTLKVLVTLGEHESPEFFRQSQEFAHLMKGLCRHVEYTTIPNVDHFNIVEDLQKEDFILSKKIIQLIKSGIVF